MMMTSKEVSAMALILIVQPDGSLPSLRGALATKQSMFPVVKWIASLRSQ
jgi:hypothetical protein